MRKNHSYDYYKTKEYKPRDLKSVLNILKLHKRDTRSFRTKPELSEKDPSALPVSYQGQPDWSTPHKGASFSSSSREVKFIKQKSTTPGPGSYKSPHEFGSNARSASIKSRIVVKNPLEQIPGPGHYKIFDKGHNPSLQKPLFKVSKSKSSALRSRNQGKDFLKSLCGVS